MSKDPKQFTNLMNELRGDYLSGIPQRVAKLKAFSKKMQWDELYHECHNLKGTGKTYGCPELTELCWPMEILAEHQAQESLDLFEQAFHLILQIGECYQNKTPLDEPTVAKLEEIKNRLTDLAKPYAAKSLRKDGM